MFPPQPLYEGDGIIHCPPKPAAAAPAIPRQTSALDLPAIIERRPHKLRALAVAALIERFLVWLENTIERVNRKPVEDYLAASVDHADLERRLRDVEQHRRPLIF